MRQPTFRQILLKQAALRLNSLGFLYDESLKDRSLTYGFQKLLGNDIEATIEFQRHQYNEIPYGYGFTIVLSRHKVDDAGQRHYRQYEEGFSARLPRLIMDAYGLRLYSSIDHWWEAAKADDFGVTLEDAIGRLELYGIPLLESRQYRHLTICGHPDERIAFQDTLDKIVLPRLSSLGYEARNDPIQLWNPGRGRLHRQE